MVVTKTVQIPEGDIGVEFGKQYNRPCVKKFGASSKLQGLLFEGDIVTGLKVGSELYYDNLTLPVLERKLDATKGNPFRDIVVIETNLSNDANRDDISRSNENAARVKMIAIEFDPTKTLHEFGRINIISVGARGTGHQSAVIKALDSLVNLKCQIPVHLSYSAYKTRFFAKAFNQYDKLDSPFDSYQRFNEDWNANYQGIKIICHPNKGTDTPQRQTGLITITPNELQEYGDRHSTYKNRARSLDEDRVEWAKMIAWTEYKWPGTLIDQSLGNYARGRQGKLKEEFKMKTENKYLDAVIVNVEGAKDLDQLSGGGKTLTLFGACDADVNTNFKDSFVPKIKRMTGEDEPVIMVFQPFLWAGDLTKIRLHVGDHLPFLDLAETMPPMTKPVYPLKLPSRKKDGDMTNSISIYYSQEEDNSYGKIVPRLAKALTKFDPDMKVTINLLGDLTTSQNKEISEVKGKLPTAITLNAVGRTQAMTEYQHDSFFFITEGANTSQELYTIGTPTLSADPDGETKPWKETEPKYPQVQKLIEDASKDLVRTDDDKFVHLDNLVKFIGEVQTRESELNAYYRAWSEILQNSKSNQVVAGLRAYHNLEN